MSFPIITLVDSGPRKINAIKTIRAFTGLSLLESKKIADGTPMQIPVGLKEDEVNKFINELENVGATVEIK